MLFVTYSAIYHIVSSDTCSQQCPLSHAQCPLSHTVPLSHIMSYVTCTVSSVTCTVSYVTYTVSCHLHSSICHLRGVICHLQCHLSHTSVICAVSSVTYNVICHLHLSYAQCHLSPTMTDDTANYTMSSADSSFQEFEEGLGFNLVQVLRCSMVGRFVEASWPGMTHFDHAATAL